MLFPYVLIHWLIVASLTLTGVGVVVLLLLITADFLKRNIW